MVVARARGEGAHQRRRAGRGRPCPHQRRARDLSGPRRESRRRLDHRARPQRPRPESARFRRAAGRRPGSARALRRFARTRGITICSRISAGAEPLETPRRKCPASLAAAVFLRYATPENRPVSESPVPEFWMTYVVTEACIKCKYTDCVEVCPVDCFYEGDNMLVIHPDECIDCGVCEPECPADAIKPDTKPGLEKWLEVNTEYAKTWPNITQKKDQPPDAKDFEGMEGKFEKYFSKEPGTGD